MPGLKDSIKFGNDYIDPIAARTLFNIWRVGKGINQKIYNRPTTLSHDDIERIKKEGLARAVGEKIEVTEKGANVIKIMILGDNRSIFEDNGLEIDYNTSLANTKNIKIAKKQKTAQKEEDWWNRFNS
jgi:hypothetical protein